MNSLEHMLQDLAEARAKAPVTLITAAQRPPACPTEGHEYDFGICLDCGHYDPAFEPDDDMIERDYLRGFDKPVAA